MSRADAALEMLQALLVATPEAPASDADPAEILARGEDLLAARQAVLAGLIAMLGGEKLVLTDLPGASDVVERMRGREADWHAAMTHARHVLGERAQAVRRLQQRSR